MSCHTNPAFTLSLARPYLLGYFPSILERSHVSFIGIQKYFTVTVSPTIMPAVRTCL